MQEWTNKQRWTKKERKRTSSLIRPSQEILATKRYQNIFHVCCYICNNYGNKDIHCRPDGKYTVSRNRGMFSFHIQCYNCHHYGHFAKDCTKFWRRNPEKQRKKDKSEEENHRVYKVDQINEVDVVDEGREDPSRKEDLRSVPILF